MFHELQVPSSSLRPPLWLLVRAHTCSEYYLSWMEARLFMYLLYIGFWTLNWGRGVPQPCRVGKGRCRATAGALGHVFPAGRWLPTGTRAELSMPSSPYHMYQSDKPPHFPRDCIRERRRPRVSQKWSALPWVGNIGGCFFLTINCHVGTSIGD